jgi:hypothetical protein
MLNVYLAGGRRTSTKFLALLNDGTVAETDGTMHLRLRRRRRRDRTATTRISLAAGSWSIAIQGGDYRARLPSRPSARIATWTLTHAAVNTNSATAQTAAELLLATIALSVGSRPSTSASSYLYTLRWTQQ